MDAGEGEGKWRVASGEWLERRREISRFARSEGVGRRNESVFVVDAATDELEVFVKEEGAGGLAGLDGEGGQGVIFVVELDHAAKINRTDDVDVVEEEGLVEMAGIFKEKPGGSF